MFIGNLLKYQKKGVEIFENKKRVIFGNPVGTGKTVMAIAAVEKIKDVKRVLIVVEKTTVIQWVEAIKEFTDTKDEVIVVSNDEDFKKGGK